MIVRTWTAVAKSTADAAAYAEHLGGDVFPRLRALPGHLGAHLLQRIEDDGVHVLVLTTWESMEAVRRFAGEHPETAVVEPEARRVLASFDAHVRHYEVVLRS